MTKQTKVSHSTDSASRTKSSKTATGSRKCLWCKSDELPGHSPMFCVATLQERVAELEKGIRIEVYQEDWIPGFAAFHDDGNLRDTAKAHVVLNLAANLLAVEDGDIPKSDLPYIIAENIMHEVIHVLEAWCDQEFSEERVEALLTKYRDKYKPDAPAYTNPAIGSEFPSEHES
jgi:hypothetical protein